MGAPVSLPTWKLSSSHTEQRGLGGKKVEQRNQRTFEEVFWGWWRLARDPSCALLKEDIRV